MSSIDGICIYCQIGIVSEYLQNRWSLSSLLILYDLLGGRGFLGCGSGLLARHDYTDLNI